VKAEHHCMTHRGVREHESDMTTAIMLGHFKEDPATRDEFYKICMSMKGHG
jgi:GTP cyclohydrolase I